jgi:hypothetical protein
MVAMNSLEPLESRCLFSATPGLPSLSGSLTIKPSQITSPDRTYVAMLKVTNTGGDLPKTPVPVGMYINGTSSPTVEIPMAIKHGKSKNFPLDFMVRPGGAIDVENGIVTMTAKIDDGGSLRESPDTDGSASTTIFYPVNTYTGTYQVGADVEDLDITINSTDEKLESDVTADSQNFGTLTVSDAKTSIADNGNFSVNAVVSNASASVSRLVLKIKGNLDGSNGSIKGTITLSGKSSDGLFNEQATFTAST